MTAEEANQIRKQCAEQLELRNVVERLSNNPDFQKLTKEYLEHEPVRLVQLLAEPSFNLGDKKALHREEIKERMVGIARFAEYIRNVYRIAMQAEKTLNDLSQAENESASKE